MKGLIGTLSVGVALVVLFSGCVPMTYSRSITVHKDAKGNIEWTEEHEGFVEQHSEGQKIKEVQVGATPFKYLKPQ